MAEDIKNEEASNSVDEQDNKENQTNHSLNKANLIKKALIAGIAILVIFLLIILVLILTKKPNSVEETSSAQVASQIEQNIETAENKQLNENQTFQNEESDFKFDFNNLEPDKLNEQLELLTNKSLEQKALEELSLLEKEEKKSSNASSIFVESDSKTENIINSTQESVNNEVLVLNDVEEKNIEINSETKESETIENSDEPIETKTILEDEKKEPASNIKQKIEISKESKSLIVFEEKSKNEDIKASDINKYEFLKIISVAKIKGNLKKSYYDKIYNIDSSVLLCRDSLGNIEIYFGPFKDNTKQENLLSRLLEAGFSEAYNLEMEKEEFNKRCNY
ncbi:MAG: hypothetical protein PHS78_04110 [Aliarcobacter skirrowii]|uniref:hypothetical protein n=1 Tax=Aliarcobacter skirrowii TaxID=28200 RepID=UPI00243028E1|nr:hypothetical protein [Aliarcobacter skirrowii]MDD2508203.1 hypothetical protein [Aliarcobacter skirrowii]MDD3496731.1 hypothetical protein [Aliarcobacter skirrowii]